MYLSLRRCSANTTGRLVHIGNKTYASCDTYRDCAEMNGGRLVNVCYPRSLPNGTGATATVEICSCMGFAGFIPRGDEGSCWEAKCNIGPNTCLIRHAEGYFNLVSAGRGGCGARKRRPRLLDTQLCTIWVRVCGGGASGLKRIGYCSSSCSWNKSIRVSRTDTSAFCAYTFYSYNHSFASHTFSLPIHLSAERFFSSCSCSA